MPRRACLIPGFDDVRSASLGHNALGAGISGAGPSMVAWFQSREQAELAAAPMQQAFAEAGVNSRGFVSSVAGPAAEIGRASCRERGEGRGGAGGVGKKGQQGR